MNNKSGCILVGFFGAMFLLQIWVAQAQTNRDLSDRDPVAMQAMSKITHDQDLIKQLKWSSLEKSEQQPKKSTSGNGKKKVEKEVVWYNPWTWFK